MRTPRRRVIGIEYETPDPHIRVAFARDLGIGGGFNARQIDARA